jgi:Helix-turn-helix domain
MSNKIARRARRTHHKGPRYIQLFQYVLESPAYISLSSNARAALVDVIRGYNGSNNGKIILSVRQLAERMGCAINTAMRALQELVDKGFIEPRVKGAFSVKFRRASEWRLNDRRCDATGVLQSQAFLKWQDPDPKGRRKSKTRSQNLRPYGLKNEDTGNFGPGPERSQNLRHSKKFHGSKICDTSKSTRAMAPNGARVEPVGEGEDEAGGRVAKPPAYAPIGHNAGPPLEPEWSQIFGTSRKKYSLGICSPGGLTVMSPTEFFATSRKCTRNAGGSGSPSESANDAANSQPNNRR